VEKNNILFAVQIGSRSSVYSPESRVRKTGSFIYEDFMPTDGTDVKVRLKCFKCNRFHASRISYFTSYEVSYIVLFNKKKKILLFSVLKKTFCLSIHPSSSHYKSIFSIF